MRVVRVETLCQSYQKWFSGPGREKKQEQDWLIWIANTSIPTGLNIIVGLICAN